MTEAEALVREGRVAASVVIPKDFERDVLRGERVRVPAHVDASYMLAYSHVLKGLLESAGTLSAGIEVARWRAAGKTADAAMHARQPIVADLRPLFSPAGGYGTYVVPAVLVLVLQQTLIIGAGIAGGTRREQLAASGAAGNGSAAGVFAPILEVVGRSVPYLLLYSVNLAYCFGFVLPYQGYPVEGPPAAIAWLAVPFLLATTFLALALRGLFRRRETAVQALLFTSLPFVFLGGFSWPPEALPHWLRTAAQLVPTTTAIPGFLRIARMGAELPDVAREATMLWVLALLYFPLACWAEAADQRRRGRFPARTGAES
jgi:ABC-2 type transport system permease protein